MGSWSVSCGISHIAITSGDECAILPLKKSTGSEYHKFQAATLPIFGKYNDYGGMEDIVEDDNTKLIEEHFGVTIDEFVTYLVDGKFTYDREESKEVMEKLKHAEECEEWRFMWIDKKVYEAMLIDPDHWHKGHNDYGTPEMLKMLGFKKVPNAKCKNYDAKRFNQLWENKKGVKFYSDGNTLLSYGDPKGGSYVYHLGKGKDDETSLEHYFDVPAKFDYLKSVNQSKTWRLMNEQKRNEHYGWIMGGRYEFDRFSFLMEENLTKLMNTIADKILSKDPATLTEKEKKQVDELQETIKKAKEKQADLKIHRKYYADFETWGDRIADLYQLVRNLHPMSHELLPHTLYLTPQCGEHDEHAIFLNEFTKINYKKYLDHDADTEQLRKIKTYTEADLKAMYDLAWERSKANWEYNFNEGVTDLIEKERTVEVE